MSKIRPLHKVPDSDLVLSYEKHGNVWLVAEEVGMSGQQVHVRLSRLNVIKKMNYWTDNDDVLLAEKYIEYRDNWMLDVLAKKLGRTKPFICRQAKRLGLTSTNNKVPERFKTNLSIKTKERLAIDGHPRGMLGKKHTEDFKMQASIRSKSMWNNPNSKINSKEVKQKQSDRMAKQQASGIMANNYSRVKNGTVAIDNRVIFFRSSWEANIAAYLQFKKEHGLIQEWEFEVDVFWFENIKRGVRSYKPDFKITNNDGSQYYIEVKGWMDAKSKTKLKRMTKYYPDIKIEVLGSKEYKEVSKNNGLYKYWGLLDSATTPKGIIKCSVVGCDEKNHSKKLCRKHYYLKYKK